MRTLKRTVALVLMICLSITVISIAPKKAKASSNCPFPISTLMKNGGGNTGGNTDEGSGGTDAFKPGGGSSGGGSTSGGDTGGEPSSKPERTERPHRTYNPRESPSATPSMSFIIITPVRTPTPDPSASPSTRPTLPIFTPEPTGTIRPTLVPTDPNTTPTPNPTGTPNPTATVNPTSSPTQDPLTKYVYAKAQVMTVGGGLIHTLRFTDAQPQIRYEDGLYVKEAATDGYTPREALFTIVCDKGYKVQSITIDSNEQSIPDNGVVTVNYTTTLASAHLLQVWFETPCSLYDIFYLHR